LTVIRASFAEINASFEILSSREQTPMPNNDSVTVSYRHLLLLESQKQEEYFPDGSSHVYNVQELLGTVRIESQYGEKELIRILKKIVSEADTTERILEKANAVVILQPNVMGVGLNLNAVVKRVFKKRVLEKGRNE